MKHIWGWCVIIVLSLCITFSMSEMLSWYHFGDYPTLTVAVRLIFAFLIVVGILKTLQVAICKFRKRK